MSECNELEEASMVGTTGDVYAATQDPYLKHVIRHIQANPIDNDPNYTGVDWNEEMKEHIHEKYGINPIFAGTVIINCENYVLDEQRQESSHVS
ncbi:MAG: hypothetical protein AAB462_01260 [Patescibacteria group bacterium]